MFLGRLRSLLRRLPFGCDGYVFDDGYVLCLTVTLFVGGGYVVAVAVTFLL